MKRYFPWVLFVTFICVVVGLNLTAPFATDDFFYGITKELNAIGIRTRLSSLGEVFTENAADPYRPVVHFFARLFAGLLGKTAFSIANALMLGALLLLIFRLARGTWKLTTTHTPILLLLVFCILCKGESYLWCAGSVNYLWAGTFTLLFCFIRSKLEENRISLLSAILLMPVALLFGWAQEAFVLSVCFALGLYTLFHCKELSLKKILLYGAYGVGALLLIASSSGRAKGLDYSLLTLIGTQIKIWVALKAVILLLVGFLFIREKRTFLKRNAFELLVIMGSILLISVVGFNGERSLWAANLFAIIIILREFEPPKWLSQAFIAILIPLWIIVLYLGVQIKANFDTFIELYLASSDGITCHERVNCGPFARFFHQSIYLFDNKTGHSRVLGYYYGRETGPIGLSRELYDHLYLENNFCIPENKLAIDGNFYTTLTSNAIVMPIPAEDRSDWAQYSVAVSYEMPTGVLAWIKYELALRRDPPIADMSHLTFLKTTHGNYLLIGKKPVAPSCVKQIRFNFIPGVREDK